MKMIEPMGYNKGSAKRKDYSYEWHIKNRERSQINDLILHHKFVEKQQQVKLKISRREK
jgi:hypothetical protein